MMDTRILEIKTLENKIKNISSGVDFHCVSLGNFIVMSESSDHSVIIEKDNLLSDLKNVKEIFYNFDEATRKKEIVNNNKKRISDIDQKIKETLKKINELEKENGKHYIGIAETLYELYKIDKQKMAEFVPYFTELEALDNKNKEISDKIKEIESDPKPSFFARLKDTGEKTILNAKKKYNYSLMLSYFKTAGEKMCTDRIYDDVRYSDLEALFASYKTNYRIGEELSSDIETFNSEKNTLKIENENIMKEFNFDPNSFIKEIKIKKDAAVKDFGKKIFDIIDESAEDKELAAYLKEAGQEIKRLVDEIKVLNAEKDELDKKIEKIRLTIEIDDTEKAITNYKTAIERKNQKIADLNKEIEEYINMIKNAEIQLEELRNKLGQY
ncbi:MAG: hypothetical protein FWC36_06525 [Spirochaetes bacterium]|nr:hypothetical protein [Spirochaetota bacterium]